MSDCSLDNTVQGIASFENQFIADVQVRGSVDRAVPHIDQQTSKEQDSLRASIKMH